MPLTPDKFAACLTNWLVKLQKSCTVIIQY